VTDIFRIGGLVFPVFGIIALGFALRKAGLVKANWVHILNMFVYYVSLPAIILVSFWQIDLTNPIFVKTLGINFLVMSVLAIALLVFLFFLKIDRQKKAAIFLTSLSGNTIYMGLPIASSVVGITFYSSIVAIGIVQLSIGFLFSIILLEFWVSRTKSIKNYVLGVVKNPIIASTVIGILFSILLREHVDTALKRMLEMLGATSSPLALFSLGSFLGGKFVKDHLPLATVPTAIKLLVLPVITFAGFYLFKLKGPEVNISVLLSAMPAAVNTFVLAEKFRLDKSYVANVILISTVVSVLTLWLFLAVIFA
jgi:hypothetical protein